MYLIQVRIVGAGEAIPSASALHHPPALHINAEAGDAGKDGNNESPLSEVGLEMDIGTASPVDGALAGITAAQ